MRLCPMPSFIRSAPLLAACMEVYHSRGWRCARGNQLFDTALSCAFLGPDFDTEDGAGVRPQEPPRARRSAERGGVGQLEVMYFRVSREAFERARGLTRPRRPWASTNDPHRSTWDSTYGRAAIYALVKRRKKDRDRPSPPGRPLRRGPGPAGADHEQNDGDVGHGRQPTRRVAPTVPSAGFGSARGKFYRCLCAS